MPTWSDCSCPSGVPDGAPVPHQATRLFLVFALLRYEETCKKSLSSYVSPPPWNEKGRESHPASNLLGRETPKVKGIREPLERQLELAVPGNNGKGDTTNQVFTNILDKNVFFLELVL